jgi:pimeloyl-ACP methyl ester carboxylesterase
MLKYLICLLLSLFPAAAHAIIAKQDVRPGISASAEYLVGKRSNPAILLLHGFLQTREFPTVTTLARGLNDSGYTVLSPTLSLNIPNRSQSLACEAAHKHSLDDDNAEIQRWIAWLKSHGHRDIILVGHSYGSMQLLAYLSAQPDAVVKGLIGASLIEAQIGSVSRADLIAQLEKRVRNKQRALVTHTLSICKRYTSTPESLLSHVYWDQARLLSALKQSPVKVRLIMGDADTMLGRGWIGTLQREQTPMVIIKGANHFMDGSHEFDLLDHTLKSLDEMARPSPK